MLTDTVLRRVPRSISALAASVALTGALTVALLIELQAEILSRVVDEPRSGSGVLLVDEVLGGSLLSFL